VKNVKDAIKFLNNQTENTVKLFRSDNGTEFMNEELKEFFSEKGIQFGLNAPHNSQSNCMIQRNVRTGQDQPEGYEVGTRNLICKLVKGLYGLKQAPRAWHETLGKKLEEMVFVPLESDPCLYRKETREHLSSCEE
jgi:transposase InsO family protein